MPRSRIPKLPPIPESEIQSNGIKILESLGCIAHRRNTGAITFPATDRWARRFVQFSEKGASDVWIVLPSGAHGEVEIKRKGERPTLDQVLWLMRHNGHGSSVAWWSDSVDSVERVARHVIAGGRVRFSEEARSYTIKVKGKAAKTWGPCGNFELV